MREKLGAIASFIVDSYHHDPDLMKVIIVEVTRAANSFGQTHIGTIREAYELIGEMIAKAQEEGVFKPEIEARFAAMAFYGAIEQLLTGWIFGLLPQGEEYFERAKWLVVETSAAASRSTPSASRRRLSGAVGGCLRRAAVVKATPAGNRLARDGERDGQATDLVGPARRRRRAREHRREPHGGVHLAAPVRRGAAGVSERRRHGEDPRRQQPQNIAAAITEISERATLLVREEIELAKAEVTEKGDQAARGAVVGVAAGVFFLTALVFVLSAARGSSTTTSPAATSPTSGASSRWP